MISKTQQALALLRSDPNMSKYEAAKQVGLSPTALYAAIKREQDHYARARCPCCDHALRPGVVVADTVPEFKERLLRVLRVSEETADASGKKWLAMVAARVADM